MSPSPAAAPRSFSEALVALRSAQKPSAGVAAYSRHVNRPLGRLVAAAGHSVSMTPNQATAVSALMSGGAIVLIAVADRTVLVAVLAAVLLAGGYVMDSVDGQLSRLRGGGSLTGEWLDHTLDCAKNSTLHLAVAISWFRDPVGGDGWLLVPLAFTVVASVTFFGLVLVPTMRPTRNTGSTLRAADQRENPLRRFLLLPLDYGFVCWCFALLAWDAGFRVLYLLLLVAATGGLLLALTKWWRELGRLDAERARGAGAK